MKQLLMIVLFAAAPVVAAAQPVQSQGTARAAGMPLNDGSLPPGMLIVRVVRGGFSNNAARQAVTVETAAGATRTAQTGSDGRAQFMHLDPGTQVRVSARVDDQLVESDSFPMPTDSGVRVLLVGPGDGSSDTVAAGPVTLAAPLTSAPPLTTDSAPVAAVASTAAPAVVAATAVPAANGDAQTVRVLQTVLLCSTLVAIAFFVFGRPRRLPDDR